MGIKAVRAGQPSSSSVPIFEGNGRPASVREDDRIRVTSRRGSIEDSAKVTDRIAEGTLFIPFHFVEGAANALTNVALDSVAKIPEYKVCAGRVEKAG